MNVDGCLGCEDAGAAAELGERVCTERLETLQLGDSACSDTADRDHLLPLVLGMERAAASGDACRLTTLDLSRSQSATSLPPAATPYRRGGRRRSLTGASPGWMRLLRSEAVPLKRLLLEGTQLQSVAPIVAGINESCLEELDLRATALSERERCAPPLVHGAPRATQPPIRHAVHVARLGDALCRNDMLEVLRLSYSEVGDAGAAALGRALGSNRTLRVLELQCTAVGPDGGPARCAARRSRLMRSAAGCLQLCAGLRQNRTLERLSIGGNPLSTACVRPIANLLAYNCRLDIEFEDWEAMVDADDSLGERSAAAPPRPFAAAHGVPRSGRFRPLDRRRFASSAGSRGY